MGYGRTWEIRLSAGTHTYALARSSQTTWWSVCFFLPIESVPKSWLNTPHSQGNLGLQLSGNCCPHNCLPGLILSYVSSWLQRRSSILCWAGRCFWTGWCSGNPFLKWRWWQFCFTLMKWMKSCPGFLFTAPAQWSTRRGSLALPSPLLKLSSRPFAQGDVPSPVDGFYAYLSHSTSA